MSHRARLTCASSGFHEEEDHARSSPLVRKIAREHDINLAQCPEPDSAAVSQAGHHRFLEKKFGRSRAAGCRCASAPAAAKTDAGLPPVSNSRRSGADEPRAQDYRAAHDRVAPHSAHVHCMFEVD